MRTTERFDTIVIGARQAGLATGYHLARLGIDFVLATGAYHRPRVPAFAAELDPGIVALHSSEYTDPTRLREGGVLVVGAGNSGAEIAFDVCATHPTWLFGRDVGHLPFHTGSAWDRLLTPTIWFLASRVLTVDTPITTAAW